MKLLSRVRLFATPWTAAYQASPPLGFSRQEYWSGVPLPSPLLMVIHPLICVVLGLRGRWQKRSSDSLEQRWGGEGLALSFCS